MPADVGLVETKSLDITERHVYLSCSVKVAAQTRVAQALGCMGHTRWE